MGFNEQRMVSPLRQLSAYRWEQLGSGWWVVEFEGNLRTGPFKSQWTATQYYRRVLGLELVDLEAARVERRGLSSKYDTYDNLER